jgi:hypothetical protein
LNSTWPEGRICQRSITNDYAGVEQWSRFIREGQYAVHTMLHREQERFAALWDKNLSAQRFVEAFTDKCIRG